MEEFQKANSLEVTGVIEDKEKALLVLGDECGFSQEYAKRAAVGIASYKNDVLTLVGIE